MRASEDQIAAIHPDFVEAAVAASVPDGICRPGTNQTIELLTRWNQRIYPTAVLPVLPITSDRLCNRRKVSLALEPGVCSYQAACAA